MSISFDANRLAPSAGSSLVPEPHPLPSDESLTPEADCQPKMTGLNEGQRVGRFVAFRDQDGRLHAVAASAVGAMCETDDGTLLMLPGGRMLHVPRPMITVLAWLDGRGYVTDPA